MNSNILVPTVGSGLSPSKVPAASDTGQSNTISAENTPFASHLEAKTTDNIQTNDQANSVNEVQQDFQQPPSEKTESQTTENGQIKPKTKPENPESDSGTLVTQASLVSAQASVTTIGVLRENVGEKIDNPTHTAKQIPVQVSKQTVTKPGQTLPETLPSATTVDQSQIKPQTALPGTPSELLITDSQSEQGQNTEKTQLSDKAPVITENPVSQQIGGNSIYKTPAQGSETAVVTETPAVTAQTADSGVQETGVINNSFPIVQDKSAAPPAEPAALTPEIPILSAEKPTGDNVHTAQVGTTQVDTVQRGQILPESSTEPEKPTLLTQEPTVPKVAAAEPIQIPPESPVANGKTVTDKQSSSSVVENVTTEQAQLSTVQTNSHSNLFSDNNSSNPNFEQILSVNNASSTTIADQTLDSVSVGKAPSSALPSDVSTDVGRQIQESISTSLRQGEQQIIIRLNPPELGKVLIKFQEQQGQLVGLVEVSKAQTRVEIQQALSQIIQNLQSSGIQVKKLEVVLTDQQEQQAFKDQSFAAGRDSWTGQQNSSGNPSQANTSDQPGLNERLTNTEWYTGFAEPQEMLVSNDFIDMLA